MKQKQTFQIFTLGCKVNQYESEQIREILLDSGWEQTEAEPDWCVVNTCAVTQESEAKSRRLIRQKIKKNAPKNVLVFGCSAENDQVQYAAIPGVTRVVTGPKHGGNRVAAVLETLGIQPELCESVLGGGLRQFGERHRAYVKVQDGCAQFCTYCLIPHLRHELTSVPPEEVCEEVRSLVRHGYREIILTGIHLGYYGLNERGRSQMVWAIEDRKNPRRTNLTDLMARLVNLGTMLPASFKNEYDAGSVVPADFRLRLSSLEAHEAGDDLLHIMAENREKICPHLHLSMQSGSPTVHRRMNRPGTVEQYIERCEAAKKILDQPALTTDVIVGFPGETEKEFLETCDVVRRIGFSKIHIFPFSARPGTPAEKMGDSVPGDEKHRRELYLAEIEREMREKYLAEITGRKKKYLVERFHPETGTVTGTSEYYTQEDFPGDEEMCGTFVTK